MNEMLDKKDQLIIAHLREDGRKKLTKIAQETGIPVTTIYDKMRKYQEKKIIKKHVSLIDFSKLGYHLRAYIALRVEREDKEQIQKFLMNYGGLNSVYKVDFDYDFLVEVVFESFKELGDFLEDLKQFRVKEKKILNITEALKEEGFWGGGENGIGRPIE